MCLMTNNEKPEIAEKDITVHKRMFLDIYEKSGKYSLRTPYQGLNIGHCLPYTIEAAEPLKKGESLMPFNEDMNSWSCLLYSVAAEGVHAMVSKFNDTPSMIYVNTYLIPDSNGYIIDKEFCIGIDVVSVIPKGTRIYKCYKPYYYDDGAYYEIASEKMILKHILFPSKQWYSEEIWKEIREYVIPLIKRINKNVPTDK